MKKTSENGTDKSEPGREHDIGRQIICLKSEYLCAL